MEIGHVTARARSEFHQFASATESAAPALFY
jgi:hypothetical protein